MLKSSKTISSEVLIIGSGGAGLRTAIELHDNGITDIQIIGKCKKRDAHTKYAQGGMNAAIASLDPQDSWEVHFADTIVDGGYINDPQSVELLCKHAPDAIKELDAWGCPFAKEENGAISQRFFGAATYRRSCFSGSETGAVILNTLVDQIEKRNIPCGEEIYIWSLLTNKNGAVNGALGLDMRSGEILTYEAKIVVLATGGHSRMFNRCSSHFWENNGDGIALAHDAGAKFMDMEMFQFHPSGMTYPEQMTGHLVTEAVRGEGGILLNSEGERFMERYAPEKLELSARDVVARANYMEIEAGRGGPNGGVFLDVTHLDRDYIKERLNTIYEDWITHCNLDISEEPMEIAPTAHYSMGGILLDHNTGLTDVPNLYAVGEVGAGVHGGNRLGGNSLAEICVFGKLTGQSIISNIKDIKESVIDQNQVEQKISSFNSKHTPALRGGIQGGGSDPIEVKKEIQALMWEAAGVVRSEAKILKGLEDLKQYENLQYNISDSPALQPSNSPDLSGEARAINESLIASLDIANMLPTCRMILLSALERKESRAAHYRSDYLETKLEWQKNILCTPKNGEIEISHREIPSIPINLQKFIDNHGKTSEELAE